MEHSLKKIDQNKYELSVELGRGDLFGYLKKAEDRVVKETQIKGFRKSKAPKDIVREKVGSQYILEQALDFALKDSLAKTLNEQKLEVMKVSDINIKENSSSKLLYTVAVTTFPLIKLADISEIKVKKREVDIEPKEVENAMEFLRTSRAKFMAKEGPVEKGDRVELDFEITSGGLPLEGGVSKNHPLVIGDNKFIPGFEDRLLGMKINEERRFSLNAPADYFHKSVAGKKLDFLVKLTNIQTVEKPVLNDDFAKGLGRFRGLRELKENIQGGILEEKKTKEKQHLRLEILSKIFENSKIELPKDMVDEKLNEMIIGFDNDLHIKGMELSLYLAHLGKTEDDLRKDWRLEAEKQVGYALILNKIAKTQNLYPRPEEIEEGLNQAVQNMASRGQFNPENIDTEELKNAVTSDLTNERVFNFLEKICAV